MSKAEQQLGVVDEMDGMWQSETVMQSWNGDTSSPYKDRWTKRLMRYGVESRGVQPVPEAQRTDTQFIKVFYLWVSFNVNILTFSTGTLGPAIFGLGLRDSCLSILFFNIICCGPPAYLATWGPKLGMRQMIISRYSFGYYGVIILCIVNLIGLIGFSVLNCILGGQALASAGNGSLSWTVGIVVIAVISLFVSFCGYGVLNWYEKASWFPVLLTFIISLGVGGKHLLHPPPAEPATVVGVLSFGATLAGFSISFSSLSADFTNYYVSSVNGWRIFWYSFIGLLIPIVVLECFGAAVVVAVPSVPSWKQGYAGGNIGGLLAAMLEPVGGFGKFLAVLLSLSVAGNIAASFYSLTLNSQTFIPALIVIPRYVFSVVATAIVIPLSIVGAHTFYGTLTNFLGLIGYWPGSYVAIVMLEHLIFRQNDPGQYDIKVWNLPCKLPSGIAALGAMVASFGLAVPCIKQAWFTGPIAKTTGDIGFEVAFGVSAVLYLPFRWLEIRIQKHV